ncbi:BrnA antitoxin family protein [Acidiferrobacter thiooxydans]|uniref:BrnA antitoxin family protein n=1 Tax=Acidiferrobacter thiooxydans TaxID=163359 RepID=A0A368HH03_9GAMM|nr:hypothetical protein C4900_10845 [Acidiferrobacter thiooxydans]
MKFATNKYWAAHRPQRRKGRVIIRLSREVAARFRAAGPGWQARLDVAFQKWHDTRELS